MPNMKNKSLSPTSSSQLESTNNNNTHNNHHNLHSNNHLDNNNHHQNIINNNQIHQKNNTPQPSNMACNSAGVTKKFSPEQIKNNNASKSTSSSTTNSSSNHTNNNHTSSQQPTNGQQTNGTKFKLDEKLEKMPWFHGLLTRENAEKLLLRDGDYLVRETNKAERQYVLSGRYKGECRHIFLVDPSGVVSFFSLFFFIHLLF
jgi:hypothetical protein